VQGLGAAGAAIGPAPDVVLVMMIVLVVERQRVGHRWF